MYATAGFARGSVRGVGNPKKLSRKTHGSNAQKNLMTVHKWNGHADMGMIT